MTTVAEHAVVIGSSVAGLLAARAVADHVERVTVIERDEDPGTRTRPGVPQARHVHALLTRGKREIEELFPGVTPELVDRGALLGRPEDSTLCFSGSVLCPVDAGLETLSLSRPLLEEVLRERVAALPNVAIAHGRTVHELIADPTRRRITGVRALRRGDGGAPESVAAELVVDATGRGSRTPIWLEELGYPAPAEEDVRIDVAYTTFEFPRRDGDRDHQIIVGPRAPHRRGGAAIAAEDDRYVVTLFGLAGERAPTDLDGFRSYAASLEVPDLHDLVRDREPLRGPIFMRYPASTRRRYEELERFPEGFVVVGDAVCSFNPIYGQGMSVAATQASALSRCVRGGIERIGPRFLDAIRSTVDVAWEMATSSDARHGAVTAHSTRARIAGRYVELLQRIAASDPIVASAFLRVVTMVAPPPTLLHPRVAGRVLIGALRRRETGTPRPASTR